MCSEKDYGLFTIHCSFGGVRGNFAVVLGAGDIEENVANAMIAM